MLSWLLRSRASSSQCAPVGPSTAWWNDKQNDIAELASAPRRSEAGLLLAGEGDADLGFVADDGFTEDVVGPAVEMPVNGNGGVYSSATGGARGRRSGQACGR
jgi:hypothetical protein